MTIEMVIYSGSHRRHQSLECAIVQEGHSISWLCVLRCMVTRKSCPGSEMLGVAVCCHHEGSSNAVSLLHTEALAE